MAIDNVIAQQTTPPPSDPFKTLGEVLGIKSAIQAQREQDIALEQKQRALDDDDAIRQTLIGHAGPDGKDLDLQGALKDLAANGRGSAALKLQGQIFAWNKDNATILKETADATAKKLETASRMAQGITDEDSFQRIKPLIAGMIGPEWAGHLGAHYDPKVIESAVAEGATMSELTAKHKALFESFEKLMDDAQRWHKDKDEWAAKQPTLQQEFTVKGSGLLSLARTAEDYDAGLKLLDKGMAGLPPETHDAVLSQFDPTFSKEAVEKARLLGMTQAQRSEEKSRAAELADKERARAAADDIELSPAAIEMQAQSLAHGSGLLPAGLGPKAVNNRTKIINRAAEIFPSLDLATQTAAFKSYQSALVQEQTRLSAFNTFESTAKKNLQVFLQEAQKIVDTGSPWVNKPLRDVGKGLLGSANIAAYDTARRVVVPEFGRINTWTTTGVLSDSSRQEVDATMKSEYTYKQLYDTAKILLQDADNRKSSSEATISGLRKLMAGAPAQLQQAPGGPQAPVAAHAQGGQAGVKDGFTRMILNGVEADVANKDVSTVLANGGRIK